MGGPSISFLRYELLKNDVTIFDPFSDLKTRFRHFPTGGGGGDYLFVKMKNWIVFDIQCVVEASSFRLNHITVQNSLGFMPEVKPLHKPRGDLVLCALNTRIYDKLCHTVRGTQHTTKCVPVWCNPR